MPLATIGAPVCPSGPSPREEQGAAPQRRHSGRCGRCGHCGHPGAGLQIPCEPWTGAEDGRRPPPRVIRRCRGFTVRFRSAARTAARKHLAVGGARQRGYNSCFAYTWTLMIRGGHSSSRYGGCCRLLPALRTGRLVGRPHLVRRAAVRSVKPIPRLAGARPPSLPVTAYNFS